MLALAAIEFQSAVDFAAGGECLRGSQHFVELFEIQNRRVVEQTATKQNVGGQPVIRQQLAVNEGSAAVVARARGLLSGLAILAGQLTLHVQAAEPQARRAVS